MNEEDNYQKLIVRRYDKKNHKRDTKPPEFEILNRGATLYIYRPNEISNYASVVVSSLSDPESYSFKKIQFISELEGEEFFQTNQTIEHLVETYNNIGKQLLKEREIMKKKIEDLFQNQ